MTDDAQAAAAAAEAAAAAATKAAAGGGDDAAKAAADAAAKKADGLQFTYETEALEKVFGKAGEDGRPENLAVKYWDPDKRAVKADVVFSQLRWAEGKVGKKIDILGAPAEGSEYVVAAPEGSGLDFDTSDPAVAGLLEVARKHDLNQGFIDELIGAVSAKMTAARDEMVAAEVKLLGENGGKRMKDFSDFLGAHLSPAEVGTITEQITSAEIFDAFESLLRKVGAPNFVAGEVTAGADAASKENWEKLHFAKNERGERLMAIDKDYAKRVNALRDKVFGTERRDPSGRIVAG